MSMDSGDNKEGRGSDENVLKLPKDSLKANVPVQSSEYQNYLEANKRVEQLREEQGELRPGDLDALRDAAQGVGDKAKEVLKTSRNS